ncbi:MAG TPA: hypothetical protein VGU26_05010 [Gaiellaceae bacterium]|nr:hypothetical protein [Gaiellaceae bacterium]
MPSRKQRRRRAKARRHEWEEVWVDDEGNEIEPPSDEAQPSRNDKRARSPAGRQGGMRQVQPPSWRRVAKRGLIFAPLMFLTVSFLSSGLTTSQTVLQTVFLLAFFLPFSYAMDALMYRMYIRRGGAIRKI